MDKIKEEIKKVLSNKNTLTITKCKTNVTFIIHKLIYIFFLKTQPPQSSIENCGSYTFNHIKFLK